MAAPLHRIQWIDAEVRAGRYPNARRLAEQFEISHRQAQRDFEYLRDSLGAPLVYSARRRGFAYDGEPYVLPGPYVSAGERDVLRQLAAYYERSAAGREDPALDGMAALFSRLSGGPRYRRMGNRAPVYSELGLPFLAHLRLPEVNHHTNRVPSALRSFYRGDDRDDGILCEIHDPDAFLAALVAAGQPYRVESPSWLRDRLVARLDAIRGPNHGGATRYVVPSPVPSGHLPPGGKMTAATTDARLGMSWTSFVGATEGVLRAAKLIDPSLDHADLMGLTGRAFHLTIDERCWPGGPTMYDWPREHGMAFERLGVLAEIYHAMPDAPTYDAARRRAVTHIKASIDRGVGAVYWGVDVPEFGVVYGYDDADGVFLVDGVGKHNPGGSAPILYENVGRSCEVPELHYVVPIERVAWDAAAAHRAALKEYVERTDVRPQLMPKYPSGLRAYDNWVTALASGEYEQFGVRYNTAVLGHARDCAATYLARREGFAEVAAAAADVSAVYKRMRDALDMWRPERLGDPVSGEQAVALIPLVKEAKAAEARQLELAKVALA